MYCSVKKALQPFVFLMSEPEFPDFFRICPMLVQQIRKFSQQPHAGTLGPDVVHFLASVFICLVLQVVQFVVQGAQRSV